MHLLLHTAIYSDVAAQVDIKKVCGSEIEFNVSIIECCPIWWGRELDCRPRPVNIDLHASCAACISSWICAVDCPGVIPFTDVVDCKFIVGKICDASICHVD